MNLKTNLTKFNFKAGGNVIKYLVIHDTGNKNDSDEGGYVAIPSGSRACRLEKANEPFNPDVDSYELPHHPRPNQMSRFLRVQFR